jgi:hypothetical protein
LKAGYSDHTQLFNGSINFRHSFYPTTFVIVTQTTTLSQAVADMVTALTTTFSGGTDAIDISEANLESNGIIARLDLTNAVLHWKMSSYQKIQNQTLAGDIPDEDVDPDNNRNDVENNPLQGYVYEYPGEWRNYLKGYGFPNGVDYGTYSADGVISFGSNPAAFFGMRKPPRQPYVLGFKKKSWLKLEPGNIKSHKLSTEFKIKIDTLINKDPSLFTNDPPRKATLGVIALIGLEKMIQINIAQGVRVAVQTDKVCMCYLSDQPRAIPAQVI